MEILNTPSTKQIVQNYINHNVNLFQLNKDMKITESIIKYAEERGYEYRYDEWSELHQFKKIIVSQEEENNES
ncbi:MAG: hypothetical protein IJV31_08140 [Clostridia bacterium]|nr:hypothetical protein [Clostridia bacterium]